MEKRTTIQRRLIYDAVKELNIHATAEQVYEYVREKHPSISRATVYRNLNQMAKAGELLNVGNFYGSTHYDHRCHEHYHFICEGCRWIFDISVNIPLMNDKTEGADDFEIKGHNLSFYGLCRECKSTEATLRRQPHE